PRRVDPLPVEISLEELGGTPGGGPAVCVVGAGGDHLGPVPVDLAASAAFLVAGPPRSGRSTALATIIASLAGRARGELTVGVVCPRPSRLRELSGLPGVAAVLTGADVAAELDELLTGYRPLCLVVDDAELLADTPAAAVLERFARYARDEGSVLVAG